MKCMANGSFSVKQGVHPRLYLDQARVNQIRNATNKPNGADSVLAQAWADTEKSASRLAQALNAGGKPVLVASAKPRPLIDAAKLLGIGYLITEREEYLSAARIYSRQLAGVTPPSSGGDYTQGGRIEAMAILYDWLFDELSSAQRTLIANGIKKTIPLLSDYICGKKNALNESWECTKMPPYPNALDGHSYQNNKEILAGVLAIIDENPELMPLLQLEFSNFSGVYNDVREWVAADGGFHMGWSYSANYLSLDSIQLWRSATKNSNLVRDWQGKIIDFYIYGLRGDMKFPSRGDGKTTGLHSPEIASFALLSAQNFNYGQAMDFYNRWIEPNQTRHRFNELLYWNPKIQYKPIEDMALSRHFQNSGMVLARDTWDYPNATLLEFKSTPFWSRNHHHLDQNSFTIFYKTPLLIDSGYYDGYKSAHWSNYYTRSIAHNLITVWDPEERFSNSNKKGPACCTNDGGQKFMEIFSPTLAQIQPGGSNALDGVVAYENQDAYTYIRGNASKAYSAEKLDQSNGFVRDIIFLRKATFWDKPIIVIFDKIASTKNKASLTKRFLMHSVNEPLSIDGIKQGPGVHRIMQPTLVIQNGDGVVYSQTILPRNAVLTKMGGRSMERDFRFLVPSADSKGNYRLEGDAVEHRFKTSLMEPLPDKAQSDSWRVEVKAPVSTQVEYFLHVFSIADGLEKAPPRVEDVGDKAFAIINISGKLLLAFNKGEASAERFTLSWNGPKPDIVIVGLEPSMRYQRTNYVISDTGRTTMYFEKTSEGDLTVTASGLLALPEATDP